MTSPRLQSLYTAYILHMNGYALDHLFATVRALRRSAANEALDQFFEALERHLEMMPYEPWTPRPFA